MSCIAGIINLDGAPVERELLERMTATMKGHAPDGIDVWCSSNVGFGHARLRISPEQENERQPCTLDGNVWITADARIDGRAELIGQLRSAGGPVRNDASDVDLILHAYRVFGESFLDRLIGDFAFALWDERSKKLICARDHFGVRPFFYVRTHKVFLFASDIDALLEHPEVSRQLDEGFIADFLLFSFCMEAEPTIYHAIRRLPAASQFILDPERCRIRRYWQPPLHNEVRYKNDAEYIDQFLGLFSKAIVDRIPENGAAIELSGGMDSTSIAAVASANAKVITAYTATIHDLLPDDQEGHLAGLTAAHLNIPMVCHAIDNYALFERFDSTRLRAAEPSANPLLAAQYDKFVSIANTGARVLLSGQGGDALFNGSNTYYPQLLRSGRIRKFLGEVYRHVHGAGSFRGMGLRSMLMGTLSGEYWQPPFPDWINRDFSERVRLKERFDSGWEKWNAPTDAYSQLKTAWLSHAFEAYEKPKMPLVVRYPFMDVRLATFLLGLPNYMKSQKKIMRGAMRGKLPEVVRTRPKTALVGDQLRARLLRHREQAQIFSGLTNLSDNYVERGRYQQAYRHYLSGEGRESTWSSWIILTPVALGLWLRYKTASA